MRFGVHLLVRGHEEQDADGEGEDVETAADHGEDDVGPVEALVHEVFLEYRDGEDHHRGEECVQQGAEVDEAVLHYKHGGEHRADKAADAEMGVFVDARVREDAHDADCSEVVLMFNFSG